MTSSVDFIDNMLNSEEECSDNKLEKTYDTDIPEYRKITEESCYEFMIWANEHRSNSIDIDHFNMVLQSKIDNWITENNITWQFALTVVIDTINNQFTITKNMTVCSSNTTIGETKKYEEEEKMKPTSSEERRKLFAAAAESRKQF